MPRPAPSAGTPTAAGAANFTVQAVDSLGNTGTRAYAMNIGTVLLTVNPATLPATVVGHGYSQTVSATGGTGPYTFTISTGALPPGLTLDPATGVISGTPTSASRRDLHGAGGGFVRQYRQPRLYAERAPGSGARSGSTRPDHGAGGDRAALRLDAE